MAVAVAKDDELHKGFEIDGKIYPLPALDTLRMPEAQLMYDHCGLTIEDFVGPDEEAEDFTPDMLEEWEADVAVKVKNPGFMYSMVAIAYWRGHPSKTRAAVEKVADNANFLESTMEFVAIGEKAKADDPKASSQNEPESQKSGSSTDSPMSSGMHSVPDLVEPDEHPSPTGTGE